MPSNLVLEVSNIEMFKFYTVDSNILVGIASLILSIYEYRSIKNNIKIPRGVILFKYIATSGILLTFLVTLLFLAPRYGFYAMYNNNNLFFHLIVPILSFISFVFFEKSDIPYSYSFLGILPMIIYSTYYGSMIVINGISNDFYGFLSGNIWNMIFIFPIMILICILISFLLLFLHKKKNF